MGPESRLEARCCTLARSLGCHPIKLGGFVVGLPDRLFLLPGGRTWLVEFKRPGGPVSPAQKHQFIELTELGHPVSVIPYFEWFERLLYGKLRLPRLPVPDEPAQLRLDLP